MMRHLVLTTLLLLVVAPSAVGQAPDILRHYHLVPQFSTVHESGGFAGVDKLYRARGEFNFLQLHSQGLLTAKFDDAEIWGSQISDDPVIATVLDVDRAFNLEGLRGRLIPSFNPFADIYHFTGETADSSFVDLYAYKRGPWMYLRGSTNPPPNGADFLEYEIRALARTRPWADMNGDGRVNLADYTTLRDNLGSDMGGLTFADWKQQFGEVAPSMSEMDTAMSAALTAAAITTAPIPEPATAVLLVAGVAGGIALRRRKPRLNRCVA